MHTPLHPTQAIGLTMPKEIPVLAILSLILMSGCSNGDKLDSSQGTSMLPSVKIRDVDGSELISQNDILAYDIDRHVMTLAPGVRDRISPSQSLIGGSPFEVCVEGVTQYSGRFTTSLSSQSIDDVVIDLMAPGLDDNQLQISLGYPTRECYTHKNDPRESETVIAALRSMNKVVE